MKKIVSHTIGSFQDVPCVIVKAEDGSEFAVPLGAFRRINADVLRAEAQQALGPKASRSVGGLVRAHLLAAETFDLGTMPTETGDVIGFLVNRGTDREIQLSIRPEDARVLGPRLVEEADRCSSRPLGKH